MKRGCSDEIEKNYGGAPYILSGGTVLDHYLQDGVLRHGIAAYKKYQPYPVWGVCHYKREDGFRGDHTESAGVHSFRHIDLCTVGEKITAETILSHYLYQYSV